MRREARNKLKLIGIFIIGILLVTLISAFSFSDFWNNFFGKITGKATANKPIIYDCIQSGYICGNMDGSGARVSCSKINKDYVGNTNLDKACDSSGLAGCCKDKPLVEKPVAEFGKIQYIDMSNKDHLYSWKWCDDREINDGGMNFEVKGKIKAAYDKAGFWGSSQETKRYEDSCINSSYLREYFCQGTGAYFIDKYCKYGCDKGTCKSIGQTYTGKIYTTTNLIGDFNFDNCVNQMDVDEFNQYKGFKLGDEEYDATFDLIPDGNIDDSDLMIFSPLAKINLCSFNEEDKLSINECINGDKGSCDSISDENVKRIFVEDYNARYESDKCSDDSCRKKAALLEKYLAEDSGKSVGKIAGDELPQYECDEIICYAKETTFEAVINANVVGSSYNYGNCEKFPEESLGYCNGNKLSLDPQSQKLSLSGDFSKFNDKKVLPNDMRWYILPFGSFNINNPYLIVDDNRLFKDETSYLKELETRGIITKDNSGFLMQGNINNFQFCDTKLGQTYFILLETRNIESFVTEYDFRQLFSDEPGIIENSNSISLKDRRGLKFIQGVGLVIQRVDFIQVRMIGDSTCSYSSGSGGYSSGGGSSSGGSWRDVYPIKTPEQYINETKQNCQFGGSYCETDNIFMKDSPEVFDVCVSSNGSEYADYCQDENNVVKYSREDSISSLTGNAIKNFFTGKAVADNKGKCEEKVVACDNAGSCNKGKCEDNFCPEIIEDAGAAKVASGTSVGCSITLNKNQITIGNKILEILNEPEFQKQILSTSGYSSMQELDNEVLTGSHNNASSFSMLILEIAVKESTLKHCVNANAKNPFYCETNKASVLKNSDGSGWGVMQVNPEVHGEVVNFEKNVKTGVLIFAEAFKFKESDKYCTDSTITRTALRKYNSCNSASKRYPANVFKYQGVIEKYFPELNADVELSCAEELDGGVGKVAVNACNIPSFDELIKEDVIKKLVQKYGEKRVKDVFIANQKNKLFNKEYILAVSYEKTYKFEEIEYIVNFIDLSRNFPSAINSQDYINLYSKILNLDKTKFNTNSNPYFLLVPEIMVLVQKENLKKSESRSYDAENILKLFWLKSNDHSISQYTGSRLYKTAPYFINLYQNEINQNKYNFWASLVLKKLNSLDILINVDEHFDRADFLKTINYGSSSDIEDFLKYYSAVSPQVTNEIMLLIPEFSNIYNNGKLINENTNTRTSISLAVYRLRKENPSWGIEKSIDYILQKRKEFGNKEIIGSNTYFISFVHQEEMFSNNPLRMYAVDRGASIDISGGEDGLKGPKEKELIKNTIINSKDKGETTIWISVHGSPTRLALDQTTYFSPGEIAEILLKRGNLQEVVLILDACHSYNFAEDLIYYLEIGGSTSYPIIITETNKNRYGRFNVLLNSFISLNKKLDEPLLGKDVLNAESFSFDLQDSAFFFSQTGKDKPIEISQNYMNHECTGEECVNGVCTSTASLDVNNLEEDSCLDNPNFGNGAAKVASDEKMCEDPVLYRLDYFVPIFNKRLEKDKTEIKKWSELAGVSQEAILSGILIEDVRMDGNGIEEKVHNLKSYVRSLIPNNILNSFGHNSNPEEGKSTYGLIFCDTFRGSLLYLVGLKDLNPELKKSLLEIEKNHNQYVKENGGYGHECFGNVSYNQKVISKVGMVAIAQKAQIEYWKRAGYDIFNYKFKTINTFGERVGILVTLTSIYSPEYESPPDAKKGSKKGLLEGAVYKNRFVRCNNMGENCVVETPSDSPKLGGTILWKGRDVSYGELVKIYVDNGYANSYLQK